VRVATTRYRIAHKVAITLLDRTCSRTIWHAQQRVQPTAKIVFFRLNNPVITERVFFG